MTDWDTLNETGPAYSQAAANYDVARATLNGLMSGASPRPLALADFTSRDRTAQAERAWQAELRHRAEQKKAS